MTRYSTENIIHFRAVFHYHQCRKCIVTYSAPAFAEATDGQAGNDGKEKGLKPARIATQSVAGGGKRNCRRLRRSLLRFRQKRIYGASRKIFRAAEKIGRGKVKKVSLIHLFCAKLFLVSKFDLVAYGRYCSNRGSYTNMYI